MLGLDRQEASHRAYMRDLNPEGVKKTPPNSKPKNFTAPLT